MHRALQASCRSCVCPTRPQPPSSSSPPACPSVTSSGWGEPCEASPVASPGTHTWALKLGPVLLCRPAVCSGISAGFGENLSLLGVTWSPVVSGNPCVSRQHTVLLGVPCNGDQTNPALGWDRAPARGQNWQLPLLSICSPPGRAVSSAGSLHPLGFW